MPMENLDQVLDAPASGEEQQRFVYAGFWIRVAAFVIDFILLLIAEFLVALVLPEALASMIFVALWVGYFCGMECSENQATIGKMAVGIKVGDANGEQLSFPNALGRFFAKFLSGFIFYIGFMMAGWDVKKQGLHDKLADTYVFYK
jgi:uncharacterized RDD family membrane protein YckC